MYDVEPYVFEGELLDDDDDDDDVYDCELGYVVCSNQDVEYVEDPYEADANNNHGRYVWACPECLQELIWSV